MSALTTGVGVEGGVSTSAPLSIASKRCPDCAGLGEIFGYRGVEDGPMGVTVWPCAECDGSGYVPAECEQMARAS